MTATRALVRMLDVLAARPRTLQLRYPNLEDVFFTLLLVLFLGVLSGGDPAVQVSLTAALVTVSVMANASFVAGAGVPDLLPQQMLLLGWAIAAGMLGAAAWRRRSP